MAYILCDLDGVVFDHRHRYHLIREQPKQWDAYYAASVRDPIIVPVVELIRGYYVHGYRIVFVTGRPQRISDITHEKLQATFGVMAYNILHRANRDFRPNVELKESLLQHCIEHHHGLPALAIDDLARVVRMYRDYGVPSMQLRLPKEAT